MSNDDVRYVDPAGYSQDDWTRPSWDEYFLGIATAVAARGDCRRSRVGCVIAGPDRRVLSTGYNGSYPGGPSCLAGQCPRGLSGAPRTEDYSNCVAVHAEANALLFAGREVRGGVAYVTRAPCDGCGKLLRGAGIVRVIWSHSLGSTDWSQLDWALPDPPRR